MSDFSQNNQELNEQVIADETVSETAVEESSIFSAPVEHNDKAPKNANKKRFVSIIAATLAVAILIGGTIAVIKFIPELKDLFHKLELPFRHLIIRLFPVSS